MCGLSAIFSVNRINTNDIKTMNQMIAHRGPDDEGYFIASSKNGFYLQGSGDDSCQYIKEKYINISSTSDHKINLALAHRRLSIIDLSYTGHQPMSDHSGRYWIVFNGEIYNYKEIKNTLQSLGVQFRSNSDTEVIVNAWSLWGIDSLDYLKGMFSFIIYDQSEYRIHAVRDRFGIKPLYYFCPNEFTIYFASEIKQFTQLKHWLARQNYQIVYDFLNWSLIDHTDETFFKDVYQLKPGEYLSVILSGNQLIKKKQIWYEISTNTHIDSYENEVENYKNILLNSVKEHLNSDVPVGSCLSGGIDSSSIVGLINSLKLDGQTQKIFSALSEDPILDEGKWINFVKNKFNLESYFITPSFDFLDTSLTSLTYHQDEPFRTTSTFAQWCVFKLAKDNNIKVMLDGQGADEQLGGYSSFWGIVLAEKLRKFKLMDFSSEYKSIKEFSGLSNYQLLQRTINPFINGPLSNLIRMHFTENYNLPEWIDIDLNQIHPIDPFIELGARTQSFQKFSIVQTFNTNLQSLLHLEDRNSMAFSIEARVPFLDHELVEKSISLPTDYKFRHGVSKLILRDSMKNYLPEEIYNRKDKIGFASSEEKWMKSKKAYFYDMIIQTVNDDNSIVNNKVIPLIDAIFHGFKPFSSLPWRIISYGNWLKCFNVS